MAIITTTVNRLCAVSDIFDSFHGAKDAFSELKDRSYPEDSVFQFIQLTPNDDLEARAAVLKDLGFSPQRIEILNELLTEGKILICVDSLEEAKCFTVEKILKAAGSLGLDEFITRAKTPVKPPRRKAPIRRKKSVSKLKVEAGESKNR